MATGEQLKALEVKALGQLYALAASAARGATAGTNGSAVDVGGHKRFVCALTVTASAHEAGDTLDVYIDVSPDNSVWYNAVHFAQQAGNGAAKKEVAVLDPSNPGTDILDVTSDAAAGKVRPAVFGRYIRARWVIVEAGGDADASHTFKVEVFAA